VHLCGGEENGEQPVKKDCSNSCWEEAPIRAFLQKGVVFVDLTMSSYHYARDQELRFHDLSTLEWRWSVRSFVGVRGMESSLLKKTAPKVA
jgi:hypothetical protein